MNENPYNFTDPAPAEMFVGREELLDEMAQGLAGIGGRSYALLGGRRIGKTSFLRALARRLRQPSDDSLAMFVCPLFLDLEEADMSSESAFFGWVGRRIRADLAERWRFDRELLTTDLMPNEAFQQQVIQWKNAIMNQTGRRLRLILLLDEFEYLAQKPWAHDAMPRLRGLLLSEFTPLKMVAAGGRDFLDTILYPGSDLANVLVQRDLRVLDRQAADTLIRKSTQARPHGDILEAVLSHGGGHPYLTQYLMHYLLLRGVGQATPETVRTIAEGFSSESRVFKKWLEVISGDGSRIYRVLAVSAQPLRADQIRTEIGGTLADVKSMLRVLAYHGLVVQTSEGTSAPYRITAQMFRTWFAETESCESREPQDGSHSPLGVRVTPAIRPQTLSYTLHNPDEEYNFRSAGEVELVDTSLANRLSKIRDRLSTLARHSASNQMETEVQQEIETLTAIGNDLYDQLLPDEFKREFPRLRRHYANRGVVITSDEPHIPWEIIRPYSCDDTSGAYEEDVPLCESFQLARWVPGPGAPDRMLVSRVAVVCSRNLQEACREYEYFATLRADGVPIEVIGPLDTVRDVRNSLRRGEADLYHFACHGRFDPDDPADSKIRLSDGFLSAGDITGAIESGVRKAKPIVFLNACHSGERGHGLTRLDGWPERFVRRGASAFVGSLWEISDELAAEFAIGLYNRLWGLHGYQRMVLGEAFRQTRLAIRDTNPSNSTWLAYVLYGNPDAKVTIGKTS